MPGSSLEGYLQYKLAKQRGEAQAQEQARWTDQTATVDNLPDNLATEQSQRDLAARTAQLQNSGATILPPSWVQAGMPDAAVAHLNEIESAKPLQTAAGQALGSIPSLKKPELPAQPSPQLAPQGPITESVTTRSSTTHSPDFDPRLAGQVAALADQRKAQALSISDEKRKIYDQTKQLQQTWQDEAQGLRDRYGDQAKHFYSRYEKAASNLDRLSKDIEASELDPTKTWGSMSTAQSVVSAIAMGLSRYSSMGSAGAVKLIDDSINRDLEVQRQRIAKLMQSAQLSEREMARAWDQYRSLEGDRKQAAAQMATYQLAQQTLSLNGVEAKAAAADVINATDQWQLGLKNQMRAKTSSSTSTVTKTTSGGSSGGKGDTLSDREQKRFSSGVQALEGLGQWDQFAAKKDPGKLGTWAHGIGLTELNQSAKDKYNQAAAIRSTTQAHAAEALGMTTKDIGKGWDPDSADDDKAGADQLRSQIRDRLRTMIQSKPALARTLSPQQLNLIMGNK